MKQNKNILVLTYWSYNDALIQTYTLPYLRIIKKIIGEESSIHLVTFNKSSESNATGKENSQDLRFVHRLNFNYFPFGVTSVCYNLLVIFRLLYFCFSKKITCIHAWCTPAGSLGFLLSKLTGIPLILDSFEPHAEAMVENGTWSKGSLAYRILFFFEKLQSGHASVIIATTAGMKGYLKDKWKVEKEQFYVKPACIDYNSFSNDEGEREILRTELKLNGKIVAVYAGKLGGIYLKKEIFEFISVASAFWKGNFTFLLLSDAPSAEVTFLAKASGLPAHEIICKYLPHAEVSRYIALADFALNFVKPVPSKRYCTSIKDGEYWVAGLPVVIPEGISDDSGIIQTEHIGAVLTAFNDTAYGEAVKEIEFLLKQNNRRERIIKIQSVGKKYRNMSIAEEVYRTIYL